MSFYSLSHVSFRVPVCLIIDWESLLLAFFPPWLCSTRSASLEIMACKPEQVSDCANSYVYKSKPPSVEPTHPLPINENWIFRGSGMWRKGTEVSTQIETQPKHPCSHWKQGREREFPVVRGSLQCLNMVSYKHLI